MPSQSNRIVVAPSPRLLTNAKTFTSYCPAGHELGVTFGPLRSMKTAMVSSAPPASEDIEDGTKFTWAPVQNVSGNVLGVLMMASIPITIGPRSREPRFLRTSTVSRSSPGRLTKDGENTMSPNCGPAGSSSPQPPRSPMPARTRASSASLPSSIDLLSERMFLFRLPEQTRKTHGVVQRLRSRMVDELQFLRHSYTLSLKRCGSRPPPRPEAGEVE